jgi:hypothetical protein
MKHSKNDERDEQNRRRMEQFLREMAASGQQAGALGEASRMGYTELVREFLQAGFDVNARAHGYTPLMFAGGEVEAIRLLIEAGADVNARDEQYGRTPLMCHVVCMYPARIQEKVVRVLLESGADPNIRANDGTTALDWALNNRPKKVVELLRQAGAEPSEPGVWQAVEAEMRAKAVNLDALRTAIRRKGEGYVAVSGNIEVELPDPEPLKKKVIEWLLEMYQPPEEKAASLLRDCDLSYKVVKGKDIVEQLIQIVIAAPSGTYEALQEQQIQDTIMGTFMEVCPDLGSGRVVRKK